MTNTTSTPRPNGSKRRGETWIQAVIMLAVAGMAGAASFTHVHDWTMHNSPAGTGNWFGWANAMVSELIPLAAGLEARRRVRHYGKPSHYPIALIIGAVALSLTGQFAEATPTITGRLISAVPALGFLALVKLVLSSPPTPREAPTEAVAPASMPVAASTAGVRPPVSATIPAQAFEPVLPAQLVDRAVAAAAEHHTTTGCTITVPQLAARLSLPPSTAADLLRHLHDQTPARINGHPIGAAQ